MKKLILAVLASTLLTAIAPAFADDTAYYQQFAYKKETSDDGDGEVHTQWRWLMGDQEYPIDADHFLVVHADLILLDGQKAQLRYREMEKIRDASVQGGWRYMLHGMCDAVVNGDWSAPADKFLLADASGQAAAGERATWNSQNAVKLTFARALGDPMMVGQAITLSYGYAMQDKDAMKPPFCP